MTEQEQASNAGDERHEPQRPLVEAQQFYARQLDPQEEQGGRLVIIEWLGQLPESAVHEVDRQKALVLPQRKPQQIANRAGGQTQQKEGPDTLVLSSSTDEARGRCMRIEWERKVGYRTNCCPILNCVRH